MSHTWDMSRPPYVNGDEGLAGLGPVRLRQTGVVHLPFGGLDEAGDVVQDAWFRPGGADRSEIGVSPAAGGPDIPAHAGQG
ncbi:hypothetical protein ACFQX6_59520 [Streptosporangium lutulentum]